MQLLPWFIWVLIAWKCNQFSFQSNLILLFPLQSVASIFSINKINALEGTMMNQMLMKIRSNFIFPNIAYQESCLIAPTFYVLSIAKDRVDEKPKFDIILFYHNIWYGYLFQTSIYHKPQSKLEYALDLHLTMIFTDKSVVLLRFAVAIHFCLLSLLTSCFFCWKNDDLFEKNCIKTTIIMATRNQMNWNNEN